MNQQQLEHLCILRRQLLSALRAAAPAPLTPDELVAGVPVLGDEGRAEARQALADLLTWGYAVNSGNAVQQLLRLTPAGLNQLTAAARPLDANLWGRLALA